MLRRMLQRLSESMRRFMFGRYGVDQLNLFLIGAAVVLNLISVILSRFGEICAVLGLIISLLAYVLLLWTLFRCFSQNLEKRFQENRRFLTRKARVLDRENRYYRCPNCRQTVRVPKGRGKLCIKCPKCDEKFIRKS